ncbi:MAG: sigma-70 family RNA polymerase sigma factor [Verrucomicrobiota bacterium]
MTVEDSALIERFCRAGDMNAAAELLRRYERALYNYLWQMLRHREDTEDALQESFAKALRALPRYQERNYFKSWLFRIAHNEGLNVIRRRKRESKAGKTSLKTDDDAMEASTEPDIIERAERAAALHRAIDQLPEKERQVVVMRLQSDLPFREIANVVNAPLGTVLARMHNARKKLKAILQPQLT